MALHDRTKRIVATASPDETVLDGGPAKCKVLDRLSFELLEHQLGGVAAVRQFAKSRGSGAASFLEAEWVATEAAFYYVLFNTGIHYRWPWNDIEHLAVTGSGLLGSTRTLQVRTDDEDFKLSVGKRAAESLTQLAKMHADK